MKKFLMLILIVFALTAKSCFAEQAGMQQLTIENKTSHILGVGLYPPLKLNVHYTEVPKSDPKTEEILVNQKIKAEKTSLFRIDLFKIIQIKLF